MLRLAELAALGYGSGVIVAQVVKVRLVAAVAGFNSNLNAVFLHSKFSSLNLYVNIIPSNSDLSKNFLLLRNFFRRETACRFEQKSLDKARVSPRTDQDLEGQRNSLRSNYARFHRISLGFLKNYR